MLKAFSNVRYYNNVPLRFCAYSKLVLCVVTVVKCLILILNSLYIVSCLVPICENNYFHAM